MRTRLAWGYSSLLFVLLLSGCDQLPGKPGAEEIRPDEVKDFSRLYASNCAACHGEDGRNGPSIALANPEYQAIVDDDSLRKAIRDGGPGKLMPGFGTSAGGMLTDDQIEVLVKGIRQRWYKEGILQGQNVPSYKTTLQGDVTHGEQAFQTYCSSCHREKSPRKNDASILEVSYLDLVSDQSLRTLIIAGRPDLGHPDWSHDLPGHALSDQDVTDIVAWMANRRDDNATQSQWKSPTNRSQK
jgi:cytochrome c oxidase cbb3-type subunit 3